MSKNPVNTLVALVLLLATTTPSFGQQWASEMFETLEHDFGTVAAGAETVFRFKLTNKYVEDIHISHVSSSCGCTSPSIEKQTLKTWEEGAIIARFNTHSFRGTKSATIRVSIDRPYPAEVQLHVKGNILGDIAFVPGKIKFGEVPENQTKRVTVQVIKSNSPNWKIQDVKSTFRNIRVGLRELYRTAYQVRYEMIVELDDKAPPGFLNGELHLVSNLPAAATIPISFEARVVPKLVVSPGIVSWGLLHPDQSRSKKIILKSEKPFRVLRIETNSQCFSLKADNLAKTLHVLQAEFNADAELGRRECLAKIYTDLNTQPEITVKAVALVEEPPADRISSK